jgi:hypothetical protein
MSASLFCSFVSYRSSFAGKECSSLATHRHEDEDYCRDHWVYVTGAISVCSLCQNPKYEDIRVGRFEHSCSAWDNGYDCMCFENDDTCHCEFRATSDFEEADRTPVEPVRLTMPEGWECEECGDGDAFCSKSIDQELCDMCAKHEDWKWERTGYDSLD